VVGRVQVKKVNSVEWINAQSGMILDKGDLIQTGSDGMARITFADGSTYIAKPDTWVTVEENTVEKNRATHVGVRVNTGAVDLSTGAWEVPGSSAKVSFADAMASLRENTRAAVRSSPGSNQHEITVRAGGADIVRGNETIPVERYEKLSFAQGGPVEKTRVLAPPEPVEPVNYQAITAPEPKREPIRLSWRPVPEAVAYQVRVSTSSMFSSMVAQRRVTAPNVVLAGLEPGDYFWTVTAIDAQDRSSDPSDVYKFTLFAQGKTEQMVLEIEGTQLHGNVVEVIGRTEPGAALLVNGQTVASIQADGRFRHFTDPLPRGSHAIRMVGQNRRGATASKDITVVIP